jgi:hypothetical protein
MLCINQYSSLSQDIRFFPSASTGWILQHTLSTVVYTSAFPNIIVTSKNSLLPAKYEVLILPKPLLQLQTQHLRFTKPEHVLSPHALSLAQPVHGHRLSTIRNTEETYNYGGIWLWVKHAPGGNSWNYVAWHRKSSLLLCLTSSPSTCYSYRHSKIAKFEIITNALSTLVRKVILHYIFSYLFLLTSKYNVK